MAFFCAVFSHTSPPMVSRATSVVPLCALPAESTALCVTISFQAGGAACACRFTLRGARIWRTP